MNPLRTLYLSASIALGASACLGVPSVDGNNGSPDSAPADAGPDSEGTSDVDTPNDTGDVLVVDEAPDEDMRPACGLADREVRWHSVMIDPNILTDEDYFELALAHPRLLYVAGGNHTDPNNPEADARIWTSTNLGPLVFALDEEPRFSFQSAKCGPDQCWFGGGQNQLRIPNPDDPADFPWVTVTNFPNGSTNWDIAWTGFGIVAAENRGWVTGENDIYAYTGFSVDAHWRYVGCGGSHCLGEVGVGSASPFARQIAVSADRGKTFTVIDQVGIAATCDNDTCRVEDVDGNADGSLFVTINDTGAFASRDQGATWEAFDLPGAVTEPRSIEFGEPDSWVGTRGGELFHSVDQGQTWEQFDGPPMPTGAGSVVDIDVAHPGSIEQRFGPNYSITAFRFGREIHVVELVCPGYL